VALHLAVVVQKDYASGIPVQISVYHEKLMIWNPGQLPPDLTVERLLGKHSSQPFNPDVANAFFRAGMIEAWGRGIERMMGACEKAGTPVPEFDCEQTGLWTVFHYSPERMVGATQETTQETTQEKILALLRFNPSMTRNELAANIRLTPDGIK